MAAVPDAVRRSLEKLIMKSYEYQSEFMRKYHQMALETGRAEGVKAGRAEGVKAGRAEGVKAGRAEGVKAGHVEGLRDAVLELARTKLADLSPDEIAVVRGLREEAMLLALIGALARAATSDEARAELHRAVAGQARPAHDAL